MTQPMFAYLATGGANNGGTEAMNGTAELHPGIARSSSNPTSHRFRINPARGGLTRTNLR